jgi:hypothetical protein
METVRFALVLGIFVFIFGILNLQGYVTFIHKQWIEEKTKKIYSRLMGIGCLLIGGALMMFAGCSLLAQNEQLYLVGSLVVVILIVVGLGLCLYAMIRYNKSIL